MNPLDQLSTEDLDRLCHLAFWVGLGADRETSWGETRREMEQYLAGVPNETVSRFQEFLTIEDDLPVPEDHGTRIASLPQPLRERMVRLAQTLRAEPMEQALLEAALSEDESALLLRWTNWTGLAEPARRGAPPASRAITPRGR